MNLEEKKEDKLSYQDVAKQLIDSLRKHQRDLQMISLIFQDELEKYFKNSKDFDLIFPPISKLYSFTITLLGALEDAIEIFKDGDIFNVGSCFEGNYYSILLHYFFDIYKEHCFSFNIS